MLQQSYDYQLKFQETHNTNPSSLNANAGWKKCRTIIVTPEWAAQLVLNDSFEVRNAFAITIGHELTHKKKEPFVIQCTRKRTQFFAYVREVHADFGAAQMMCNSSRDALLCSMHFKKKFKEDTVGLKDKDRFTHPSWKSRIFYVSEFNFGEALVRQIANDLKYRNKKTIAYMANYFDQIELV